MFIVAGGGGGEGYNRQSSSSSIADGNGFPGGGEVGGGGSLGGTLTSGGKGGGDGGAAPFGFAPSPSLSLPEGADKDKYEHLLARLNNTSTSTASALLIDEKSRLKDMVQTLEKQGVTIDDKLLSVLRNLREKEKEAAVEEVNSPSYGKAALREALFGNGEAEEED
jgi:hypothetical protein